jgi:hypothetical protein
MVCSQIEPLLFFIHLFLIFQYSYRPDMAKVRPAGHMRPSRLFWQPLSLKYLFPHSPFFKKILLFNPKNDIFEEHFRNLLKFTQICREIFKIILNPSTPIYLFHVWNELAGLRTFKITENGP